MHNTIPTTDLPSTRSLIKSTVIAAISAIFILITIVLPAEYGIDPTGIGNLIGLKKMGDIKVSLAEEAATERAAEAMLSAAPVPLSEVAKDRETEEAVSVIGDLAEPEVQAAVDLPRDEMTVTLAPNEGAEIKVALKQGEQVIYKWWTDNGRANFDIHGDSEPLNISYHNYSKGSEMQSEGTVEAAFDGYHGWFWRNRTQNEITITIQTNGDYSEIKRIK